MANESYHISWKYGIKTADYQIFTNANKTIDYLKTEASFPIVLKASGLAAGKGVLICQNLQEALMAVDEIMVDQSFGKAGEKVVVEEFLEGFEASILSVFNGKTITPFISAMDHKKIGEGDTGPNTGGMGVVAPNPNFTKKDWTLFERDILNPTLKGLKEENLIFSGVIFFGLMITKKGIYLLEYNLRMGDPETQATLPLLRSNLLAIFLDAEQGKPLNLDWKDEHSCCVVMASGGYPSKIKKGFTISGLESIRMPCFGAGISEKKGELRTSGGRVLSLVGVGSSKEIAKQKAYEEISKIKFEKSYYRRDIG